MYLVKRISSFDYAQDGEPVEPYLASKDVDPPLLSCARLARLAKSATRAERAKRASRNTRYERRSPRAGINQDIIRHTGLMCGTLRAVDGYTPSFAPPSIVSGSRDRCSHSRARLPDYLSSGLSRGFWTNRHRRLAASSKGSWPAGHSCAGWSILHVSGPELAALKRKVSQWDDSI
jgi:hypothetical protein